MRAGTTTRLRRGGLVALLAMVTIGSFAPTAAHAHAQLEGTSPGTGVTVEQGPDEISITFDEHVGLELGGIKVYDPSGERVEQGDASSKGRSISTHVDADAPGTYAVSWRAISADGHPLRGAFLFNVQRESDSTAIEKAEEASQSNRPLEILLGVLRGAYLLGLLAAAGGVMFMAWVSPGWRARQLGTAIAITVLGSLAAFVIDASIAGGYGLSETLRWDVLQAQAGTVFGRGALIRACVALALGVMLLARRRVTGRWTDHVVGAVAVALAASQSLSGHAIAADDIWLRLPLDMLHMVAAAAWVGGLVQLAVAPRETPPTAAAVTRYSQVALCSVAVLVMTGLYASWDEIGFSMDGLLQTTYGRLVLLKSALLVATIPLANLNRVRHVPGMHVSAQESWQLLRRFVRIELGLLILVIAATAWLIQSVPARNEVAPPFVERTVELDSGGQLQLVIDPARAGRNEVHVYAFDDSNTPDAKVTESTLTATLDDPALGPLDFESVSTGPGHFTFREMLLPYAGEWKLTATVRRGRFEEDRAKFTVRIAPGGS